MSQEIEEIKRILLKYNPAIKEILDEGIVESKSSYQIEEFLNNVVNKEITDFDLMDVVLITKQLNKHDEKYYDKLKQEMLEEEQQRWKS